MLLEREDSLDDREDSLVEDGEVVGQEAAVAVLGMTRPRHILEKGMAQRSQGSKDGNRASGLVRWEERLLATWQETEVRDNQNQYREVVGGLVVGTVAATGAVRQFAQAARALVPQPVMRLQDSDRLHEGNHQRQE